MRRKNRFDTYEEAPHRGPYDEFPMLERGIDPQLHLSRNDRDQPFFLICEQDCVIAQMSGTARIEFRNSPANYFDVTLGDFVYVPGGTPHRILPKSESIQLRYKPNHPGLEAVAWYSPKTREEIARVTWNCAEELPQEAYLRACTAFNADAKMRTCPTTGEVLPPIDLGPYRWAQVAEEVREAEKAEEPRARKLGMLDHGKAPDVGLGAEIPPPTDERVPLRVNAYDHARTVNATLVPLFPYYAPGCIVPCVVLQDLEHKGPRGYFVHFNTVQEVNLCLGARGSNYLKPGGVAVGPTTHPVGDKPGQSPGTDVINIAVITQRQARGVPQQEAFIVLCESCNEQIFKREYAAHEFPDDLEGPLDPQIVGMPTISQSAAAITTYNGDPKQRTCPHCGHVNGMFPLEYWGWQEYRQRTHAAVTVRNTMIDAATETHATAAE